MIDAFKYLLHNLWWPFIAGAALGATCYGISALTNQWRQR